MEEFDPREYDDEYPSIYSDSSSEDDSSRSSHSEDSNSSNSEEQEDIRDLREEQREDFQPVNPLPSSIPSNRILVRQSSNLEQDISNFGQEFWTNDDKDDDNKIVDPRCFKPTYVTDPDLPKGWTYFKNKEGSMFYRNAFGKFLKSRRHALADMFFAGTYTDKEIKHIQDGLVEEGWNFHDDLPFGWMFKQSSRSGGVAEDYLGPNGVIYKSKMKIIKCARELRLSRLDARKIQQFKAGESWSNDLENLIVSDKMDSMTRPDYRQNVLVQQCLNK